MSAKKSPATRVVYMNLPVDLADRVAADAAANERTQSNHIIWIVRKHYEEREITQEDLAHLAAFIVRHGQRSKKKDR